MLNEHLKSIFALETPLLLQIIGYNDYSKIIGDAQNLHKYLEECVTQLEQLNGLLRLGKIQEVYKINWEGGTNTHK